VRAATITDTLLSGALDVFFDQTCTVKTNTPTADAVGQMVASWGNLAGHVAIPCRLSPVASMQPSRDPGPSMTTNTNTSIVLLSGHYPLVTTAMQALVDSVTYQVVKVTHDSEQFLTELEVQAVST
jgi:hypothetical protein